jgi:hypothetical protein
MGSWRPLRLRFAVQLIDRVGYQEGEYKDCTEQRGSQPNDSRSSRKIRPATMVQCGGEREKGEVRILMKQERKVGSWVPRRQEGGFLRLPSHAASYARQTERPGLSRCPAVPPFKAFRSI